MKKYAEICEYYNIANCKTYAQLDEMENVIVSDYVDGEYATEEVIEQAFNIIATLKEQASDEQHPRFRELFS